MKRILFFSLFCITTCMHADDPVQPKPSGRFDLGIRSTASLFGEAGTTGLGMGGQFRIRLTDRINTEWFADYISTNLNNLASRSDYHIGWSVLFYPLQTQRKNFRPLPYLIGGHCFDLTRVSSSVPYLLQSVTRYSSAIQGGLGAHLPIHERIDFSVNAQYMMHLGKHIHTNYGNDAYNRPYPIIELEDAALEGHLLLTFSLNVFIVDLWKGKKG
ncbi:MAG: hypothetical protein ACRCYO_19960 [Bacteroidia bacterium]